MPDPALASLALPSPLRTACSKALGQIMQLCKDSRTGRTGAILGCRRSWELALVGGVEELGLQRGEPGRRAL